MVTKAKPVAKKAVKPAAKTATKKPVVKTATKKAKPQDDESSSMDLVLNDAAYGDLDALLHDIETNIGLSQVDIKANKITTSTGLLSLDLMTSGGLVTGGWYTFFGGEQSCKSTLASTQMANAITTKIPYLLYFDYEGSFQAEYFMSIARHVGAVPPKMSDGEANQRIFGLQDDKGNWVIKPRVRYYPMSIGEKFFDYMARLMRQLPDKLYKNGKWWLVYDPENKQHKEHIKKKKPKFDEVLWKKTGKWWVETDNGLPQALVVTDSYPAMNPEKMDVDDPSAAMAMQARMFAENIKRIKGKMSSKRVTIMGINQLRLRPAVQFQNPEYEPCGESLKFNSDVRVRMASRSVQGGSGQFEEEPGVNGGIDQYRYIHMRAAKNKLSVPNLEGWARVWVRDAEGQAHGFDPVYDTFYFLKEMGMVSGTKNRLKIDHPKMKNHKPLTWLNFKKIIVGDRKMIKETLASVGVMKPFMLRDELFKLFADGTAMQVYFDKRKADADGKAKGDDDDDDDEDDE